MMTTPPAAISFESVEPVLTPQGHRIRPLVDGRPEGNTPGISVCVGGLDVPPAFIARAHRHAETDVVVLVADCGEEGALTLYGPELEHEVIQFRGEVLPIQRGWHHTVVNLSLTTPIRAYEFRANRTAVVDNPLLPHLQPIADRRGREFLLALHGPDALAHLDTGRPTGAAVQRVG